MEEYKTVQEASAEWGLSVRRIQTLCNENRIEGAKKFGGVWAIPKSAEKPKDGRIKSGKYTNWRKNI